MLFNECGCQLGPCEGNERTVLSKNDKQTIKGDKVGDDGEEVRSGTSKEGGKIKGKVPLTNHFRLSGMTLKEAQG